MKKEITSRNQCYNCTFIGTVSGSVHSSCRRFIQKSDFNPPKADIHGIKSGWYNFPYNYDPVWQNELCEGFENKNK